MPKGLRCFPQARHLLAFFIVAIALLASSLSVWKPFATSIVASDIVVQIRKSAPSLVEKGGYATFRVEVRNTNLADAPYVRTIVAIPTSMTMNPARTSPECRLVASNVICTGPSVLVSGGVWETVVSLSIPSNFKPTECPGNFTVWARAESDSIDTNPDNNIAGATIPAECIQQISSSSASYSSNRLISSSFSSVMFRSSAASVTYECPPVLRCNTGTNMQCNDGRFMYCLPNNCFDAEEFQNCTATVSSRAQSVPFQKRDIELRKVSTNSAVDSLGKPIVTLQYRMTNIGDVAEQPNAIIFNIPNGIMAESTDEQDCRVIFENAVVYRLRCNLLWSVQPGKNVSFALIVRPSGRCIENVPVYAEIFDANMNTYPDNSIANNRDESSIRFQCASSVRSSFASSAHSLLITSTSSQSYIKCPNGYSCINAEQCREVIQSYRTGAEPAMNHLCALGSICCTSASVQSASSAGTVICERQPLPLTRECAEYCLRVYGSYDCYGEEGGDGGDVGGGGNNTGSTGSAGTSQQGAGSVVSSASSNRTCSLPYTSCTIGDEYICTDSRGIAIGKFQCTSGCIATRCVRQSSSSSAVSIPQSSAMSNRGGGGGGTSSKPACNPAYKCLAGQEGKAYRCVAAGIIYIVGTDNGTPFKVLRVVSNVTHQSTCTSSQVNKCLECEDYAPPNFSEPRCGDFIKDLNEQCDFNAGYVQYVDNQTFYICRNCQLIPSNYVGTPLDQFSRASSGVER